MLVHLNLLFFKIHSFVVKLFFRHQLHGELLPQGLEGSHPPSGDALTKKVHYIYNQ